jgi:hypothetical protein
MKGGVETGDLRNFCEPRRDRFNPGDAARHVQRRERDQSLQVGYESVVDALRCDVIRTAVHDAMSDRVGPRQLVMIEPVDDGVDVVLFIARQQILGASVEFIDRELARRRADVETENDSALSHRPPYSAPDSACLNTRAIISCAAA